MRGSSDWSCLCFFLAAIGVPSESEAVRKWVPLPWLLAEDGVTIG